MAVTVLWSVHEAFSRFENYLGRQLCLYRTLRQALKCSVSLSSAMVFLRCVCDIQHVCPKIRRMNFETAFFGATENARPDIARLDNTAPYRKGGHRETCFSVRVDAHYKFVWFREYYMSCSSVLFVVLFLSVLLIATCGKLSWPALWTTFGRTIK